MWFCNPEKHRHIKHEIEVVRKYLIILGLITGRLLMIADHEAHVIQSSATPFPRLMPKSTA
jgi:hypothetical protein